MNVTEYKSWTLKAIADALAEENVNNTKIEVPKFQRNLVWSEEQKRMFIDSVKKGFPIGTLLFYKIPGKDTYSLIDGLQRSSTIADYINNPTKYFEAYDVDDKLIKELFMLFNSLESFDVFSERIRSDITSFLTSHKLKDSMLIPNCANELCIKYNCDLQNLMKIMNYIKPCIEEYIELYDKIAQSPMPVMVFSGDESDLPTVFERINHQGTQLGKYQIYAASWAVKNYTLKVENEDIIAQIINKYDAFVNEGYVLEGYDKEEIKFSKQLTYFEYVLGFGKYITSKYDLLFAEDKSVQDINQAGFEILNACFGKHNKDIKVLHENLHKVDINLLEKRLIEVIDAINTILKPYIGFKGNSHGGRTIYHAQNQIVSIIASAFREKYLINYDDSDNLICNLENVRETWPENLKKLKITLPQHYIYDIISHNWAEGAFGKIYSILNDNKYLSPIEKELWDSKLDDWLMTMNQRREKTNVANPRPIEKLFLNCVYVKQFSAHDQLSSDKFDIEHLATKDAMKALIKQHSWEGLPISSVANLCYLPEFDNRSKGANTIYQDQKYINYLQTKDSSLNEIEEKYTFTTKESMEWVTSSYMPDDYEIVLKAYTAFLTNRFAKMKQKFYLTLQIIKTTDEQD